MGEEGRLELVTIGRISASIAPRSISIEGITMTAGTGSIDLIGKLGEVALA